VIVAVAKNESKNPFFSMSQRQELCAQAVAHLPNVTVDAFTGLLVEYTERVGGDAVVRGLRAVSDFEWEFQMNNLNRGMAPEIETMYLMASPEYSFLSSRGVREIAAFGGSVAKYVPEPVARRLTELHAAGEI
jgi:pantetheine-phosphate adenylyltransferase